MGSQFLCISDNPRLKKGKDDFVGKSIHDSQFWHSFLKVIVVTSHKGDGRLSQSYQHRGSEVAICEFAAHAKKKRDYNDPLQHSSMDIKYQNCISVTVCRSRSRRWTQMHDWPGVAVNSGIKNKQTKGIKGK